MTRPVILGIDPGKTGALAFLDVRDGADHLHILDVPTFELLKNEKKHRQVDIYGLAKMIDDNVKDRSIVCFIEKVSSMPKQGVASSFDFGNTYGLLQGVCAAHFLRIEYVPPSVWKRHLRVPAAKDGARAAASRLFPRFAHVWARVKDDGRAEAALIAYYGSLHL